MNAHSVCIQSKCTRPVARVMVCYKDPRSLSRPHRMYLFTAVQQYIKRQCSPPTLAALVLRSVLIDFTIPRLVSHLFRNHHRWYRGCSPRFGGGFTTPAERRAHAKGVRAALSGGYQGRGRKRRPERALARTGPKTDVREDGNGYEMRCKIR